ncbi:MAG: glycosyltransferase [Candidatus Paceibacterota bacterium]|jgi:glycosyltransferase involved in cell wall biosynthesis
MLIYLSTFPPRECGIATFTRDLIDSMGLETKVIAMNDRKYRYDNRVLDVINTENVNDYIKVAKKINDNEKIKLVHIEHEFGIFGGEYGNYLLYFLNEINKPLIVTFHTVLPSPELKMKELVFNISKKASAITVMNTESKRILEEEYNIPSKKVFFIPHGIPSVPLSLGDKEKKKLKMEKNTILSTYGLISEGKGIEYFLQALPEVVKKFPNIKYLILGETHPVVKKREGEKYRNFLKKEIERLGIKSNVVFFNQYLNSRDIEFFLNATDIYLSPMLDPKQSASGTISFALGCGKPVISTATSYAKNMITDNKGILVGFRNPQEVSEAIIKMLENPKETKQMGLNSYIESRFMTWNNVALSYYELYRKYADVSSDFKIPKIKFDHLKRLTDNFGIVQFAKNIVPNLDYGYSTDDNARALIVAVNSGDNKLIKKYLNFIESVQEDNGMFYNYVNKNKIIENKEISEDVQGRVIWSLGKINNKKSIKLFNKSLSYIKDINSPRAKAFAILGLSRNKELLRVFADDLINLFNKNKNKKWNWFEDCLTYSSSRIPEALFYAYSTLKDKKYLDVAEKSLTFLIGKTFSREEYLPIGQERWYLKDSKRSLFDQQPEDPASMVESLIKAYEITKKEDYKDKALIAFEWFLGKNHLRQMVYDDSTGGCYDGLGEKSLNINQGAESTVCYLLARQAIERVLS